MKDRSTRF